MGGVRQPLVRGGIPWHAQLQTRKELCVTLHTQMKSGMAESRCAQHPQSVAPPASGPLQGGWTVPVTGLSSAKKRGWRGGMVPAAKILVRAMPVCLRNKSSTLGEVWVP